MVQPGVLLVCMEDSHKPSWFQDPEKRTRFADSAVTKLMHFGFDGLDFQFQMPGYEKRLSTTGEGKLTGPLFSPGWEKRETLNSR